MDAESFSSRILAHWKPTLDRIRDPVERVEAIERLENLSFLPHDAARILSEKCNRDFLIHRLTKKQIEELAERCFEELIDESSLDVHNICSKYGVNLFPYQETRFSNDLLDALFIAIDIQPTRYKFLREMIRYHLLRWFSRIAELPRETVEPNKPTVVPPEDRNQRSNDKEVNDR